MASSFAQANVKRQKVRESSRAIDSVDYFQGIEKVEYTNMPPLSDTLSYKWYNHSERLHGRCMEDWLKLSVSFTAFKSNGSDQHGKPTCQRTWTDNSSSGDNSKRQLKACFDFCQKLGVKYWTAFDTDLVPSWQDNSEELKSTTDDMVEFVQEHVQRGQTKPLWIAVDLHSHPRYASGAFTNCDAYTFVQTASQVKRTLEMAHRLNAEHFLLWPHREGYHALYKTDINKELKLFGKLLKMVVDYKERIGYRGQLLIMPHYSTFGDDAKRRVVIDGSLRRYMWDVTSCLCLLKHFNLEKWFKICGEPGHQSHIAQSYNMLGGISIHNNCRDAHDNKTLTLMLKSIIEQGNVVPAGIHLSLRPARDSFELRDLMLAYVRRIDMLGKCLRVAATCVSEQMFSKHVQQRYVTYHSGLGARILSGDVTLEECEEYVKKNQTQHTELQSSRSEHWDVVFQRYMDSCDHI